MQGPNNFIRQSVDRPETAPLLGVCKFAHDRKRQASIFGLNQSLLRQQGNTEMNTIIFLIGLVAIISLLGLAIVLMEWHENEKWRKRKDRINRLRDGAGRQ